MHPLERADVVDAIGRAVGRPWRAEGLEVLDGRASHPCGILHGAGRSVFVKVGELVHLEAEARGLRFVGDRSGVRVAEPIAVVALEDTAILVLEALTEIERGPAQWRAIGHELAALHAVTADTFGLADFDGFFGALPQDNRLVEGGWAAFWRDRRVEPYRRLARLPVELARRLDALLDRFDALAGDEPTPTLLHGDAQQHNVVSTSTGAALIDVAPWFGHPEVDLAMLGLFEPVPDDVVEAYREVRPLADDAAERVELWRIPADLAIIAVDRDGPFGRTFLIRLAEALTRSGV